MSETKSDKKALSKKYQKKTDIEHILDAPDTYIGSIESDTTVGYLLDENNDMKHKEYDFIGGLYKCFDEGIVNCRDHAVRLMQKILKKEKNIIPVRNIEITVDKKTGIITMMNDGNGVDVAKHPENKLWIPEMIFGHLRTSTNYKKDEKKIVGGKNGFGFKLVLIYSKWGEIETVDHIRKKKYTQRFENNLNTILEPTVKSLFLCSVNFALSALNAVNVPFSACEVLMALFLSLVRVESSFLFKAINSAFSLYCLLFSLPLLASLLFSVSKSFVAFLLASILVVNVVTAF